MSSEEELDAFADAKFNELYDAADQPAELDETFLNEYFKSISAGPEDTGLDMALPAALTTLFLSKGDPIAPLLNVVLTTQNLRFVIRPLATNWEFGGISGFIGSINPGDTYKYEVKHLRGFVRLTIKKSLFNRVEFISFRPQDIPSQKGEGTWEIS
ncbi:hypothetical protein RSOLAG22IIIB_08741 [Rhizoctonia solani]|uniref:Uncharacterized protein n=1 Tax=Rhizoctonia solani TaxID=456999 RepID=A0A0K6FUF5_9AGAM|nr:hypothetical protein RSOLAG22IIIB_08741 [Rhizoctonia solani]